MRFPFTCTIATPHSIDQARRALRIARRYRTIQRTETRAARARAVLAGIAEACIDRLLSMVALRSASDIRL